MTKQKRSSLFRRKRRGEILLGLFHCVVLRHKNAKEKPMDEQTKKRIDDMPYEEMFGRWRFAPVGDLMFQGEVGEYFAEEMKRKRIAVGDMKHCEISKYFGW
jgi:hypothetical protein